MIYEPCCHVVNGTIYVRASDNMCQVHNCIICVKMSGMPVIIVILLWLNMETHGHFMRIFFSFVYLRQVGC